MGTPFLSNSLMQELTSIFIPSSLSLVNSGTLFLNLYFHLPTTQTPSKEECQDTSSPKLATLWKSEKNFFLLEKIRLQVPKSGVLGEKSFSYFLGVFSEIKFRWNKCADIWKICKKKNSGKKYNFKF